MGRRARDEDFDSSTYVGVHERLTAFREKFPDGFETTFRQEVEGGISFKCLLFRNEKDVNLYGATSVAAATGHSFLPGELEGEKVEEYAETVALGRALAKLGFKVESSIASSEEMDQYERKTGSSESEEEDETEEEEEKPRRRRRRRASRKKDEEPEEEESEESEEEDEGEEEEKPKRRSKKVRRVSRFKR